jgi:hypothetical protein
VEGSLTACGSDYGGRAYRELVHLTRVGSTLKGSVYN